MSKDHVVFVTSVNREMDYRDFVAKLFKIDTDQVEFCHMGLGVSGEAGELADALKRHAIYGKDLDRKNVVEELGDLRFYMQAVMNKLEITESEILQGNADKLSKRYPKGEYSNVAAIARLDKMTETLNETVAEIKPSWGLIPEQQINDSIPDRPNDTKK